MQSLEVSGAVRPIYGSLGVKRLRRREMCGLLGCCAAYGGNLASYYRYYGGNSLPTFRDKLSVPKRRTVFTSTYCVTYRDADKSLARPGRKLAAPVKSVIGRGMD